MNGAGTDNLGNVPKSDDFVAYNLSGQLATGHIEKLGSGKHGAIYYIRCAAPAWNAGKRSIVRGGPRCLLVLSPSQPEVRERNIRRIERERILGGGPLT